MNISVTWTHLDNVAWKCDPIQQSNESNESFQCPIDEKRSEVPIHPKSLFGKLITRNIKVKKGEPRLLLLAYCE